MSVAAADAQALVGRRSEMAQFRAVLDACIEGPSGAVILIRGEAGIGKTRLMDELQSAAAASGMTRHSGFVLDFGTERGHGAVRTVVAGLIGLGSQASSDIVEGAIDTALRELRLQSDDALYLRDLLEVSQPEATRGFYEAMDAATRTQGKERVVSELVKASADRQPLLVAVEDIHWADAETLSLLAAITRATAASRSVLAMTTRLEGDPLDAHWRATGGRRSHDHRRPLAALSRRRAIDRSPFHRRRCFRDAMRRAGRRQSIVPRAIAPERGRPH